MTDVHHLDPPPDAVVVGVDDGPLPSELLDHAATLARGPGGRCVWSTSTARAPALAGPVVVGIDGSTDSATILRRAARVAMELGTGLHVVCAWTEPESGPPVGVEALVAAVSAAFPAVPVDLEQVEDRAGRRLVAEGRDAVLLVVGSRHGPATALRARGSTARTVLAAPPCPVLVLGPRVLDATQPAGTGRAGTGPPGPGTGTSGPAGETTGTASLDRPR